MNSGHDDDALRWEGDDESAPSRPLTRPPAAPAQDPAPVGDAPAPDTEDAADDTVTVVDEQPAPLGNVALVSLGLLAGVYLLYTVGWILGGMQLQTASGFLVADVAFVPMWVVSIAAPVLWFAITLILTRHSPVWLRFVWLGAGAVLLVPWPFLMFGLVS